MPWYEAIQFSAFADAYGSVNYNFPKPQEGQNRFRAYDTANGFSLAWVGVNASYDPDPVGGEVSLRFGPKIDTYNACASSTTRCDNSVPGLNVVKQAYASWQPGGKTGSLRLDFGKFDTIYGAEVADAQANYNYTNGIIYWLAQPLFHTGLRATYQVMPELGVKALVVNGWNNSIDNNVGKSYGLQLAVTPSDNFGAYLGWIGGPEQDDTTSTDCAAGFSYDPGIQGCAADPGAGDAASYTVDRGGANDVKAWKHLIDLVISYSPLPNLGILFNADYGTEGLAPDPTTNGDVEHVKYYGAMLAGRYAFSDVWALALRGEYFAADGLEDVTDARLASGTLTIEAKPTDNLILRLDNRADVMLDAASDKAVFAKEVRDTSETQLTTTLGVIVTTN